MAEGVAEREGGGSMGEIGKKKRCPCKYKKIGIYFYLTKGKRFSAHYKIKGIFKADFCPICGRKV